MMSVSVTCVLVGSLALLRVQEWNDVHTINVAEIRTIERDGFDFTKTRIDVVGSRSRDVVTRASQQAIHRALRNCQGREEVEEPAREVYSPPTAPPPNIMSAEAAQPIPQVEARDGR